MTALKQLLLCYLLIAATAIAAPPLPRVLVLGDSIYNDPTQFARSQLKGRVEVVWKAAGDTSSMLAGIEELLGDGKWDLIHFNCGLPDLHYKDPSTKSIRAMSKLSGGIRVTSPEQYEQNLRAITKRLQATNAKLVWASTTPIGNSSTGLYDQGSEIEYNQIAAKIMVEHQIPINDLHALVTEQRDPKKPLSGDPYSVDRTLVRAPIVAAIRKELQLPDEK